MLSLGPHVLRGLSTSPRHVVFFDVLELEHANLPRARSILGVMTGRYANFAAPKTPEAPDLSRASAVGGSLHPAYTRPDPSLHAGLDHAPSLVGVNSR
jgi:hypothetical protein